MKRPERWRKAAAFARELLVLAEREMRRREAAPRGSMPRRRRELLRMLKGKTVVDVRMDPDGYWVLDLQGPGMTVSFHLDGSF